MEIEEQINYTILCNPYNLAKALLSKRQLQLPAKAGKPADLFTKHLTGADFQWISIGFQFMFNGFPFDFH